MRRPLLRCAGRPGGLRQVAAGLMMAMVRLNVAVDLHLWRDRSCRVPYPRGPADHGPGRFRGVGQHSVDSISDEDLFEIEQAACPVGRFLRRPVHRQHHGHRRPRRSAWRCPIPLRPRRPPTRCADRFNYASGEKIHGADRQRTSAPARHRSRARRWENAAAVVAASGGSTNAALHLPAIAHECGIEFDLFDVAEIFHQDALHRRFEARREICRQGHVRGRRHSAADEDAARPWLSPRRLA